MYLAAMHDIPLISHADSSWLLLMPTTLAVLLTCDRRCVQDSGLFDAMAGISPGPPVSFGNLPQDTSMGLPMHGHNSDEQMLPSPLARLASPETQCGRTSALSDWPQSIERGVLDRAGQSPPQGLEHTQGVPQASLLAYDDRLWSGQGPTQQLQQPPATRN